MKHTITQFSNLLRAAGVTVSTSEVLDCMKALKYIDPYARTEFYSLLKTVLIKSHAQWKIFDQCFHLFFELGEASLQNSDSPASSVEETTAVESLNQYQEFLAEHLKQNSLINDHQEPSEAYTEALRFLLDGNEQILERIQRTQRAEGVVESSGFTPRGFSGIMALGKRLQLLQELEQAKKQIKRFFQEHLPNQQEQQEKWVQLQDQQVRRITSLIQMATDQPPRDTTYSQILRESSQDQGVRSRSLSSFSSEEKQQLQELIQQLIRKVQTEAILRQRRNQKGRIDIKQTFRYNMRYGGIPISLQFQSKIKRKGDIVALCDISGSVFSMVEIMLRILFAIANQFRAIRSFAFVDQLMEISSFLEAESWAEAIAKIRKEWEGKIASSDYGQAFRDFDQHYFDLIGTRTTVLILGDARNNGNLTEEVILEKIQKRAKRVIWLNPEDSRTWNRGDSEVSSYLPFCNQMRECRTFSQLEEFIHDLTR